MSLQFRRDQLVLFVGDVAVFTGSLWLALVARHFVAPNSIQFFAHLGPFSYLFALWFVVFVMVGLYDRRVALFERQLPSAIIEAQLINLVLAVAFFFLAPISIQPKIVLALYFVISTLLIVVWRLGVFRIVVGQKSIERVIVVGHGPDIDELVHEIKSTPQSHFEVVEVIDPQGMTAPEVGRRVGEALSTHGLRSVVVDGPLVLTPPGQYDILDASYVYESLFDRVPLTLSESTSFAWQTSVVHSAYDIAKRIVDILLSALLLVILLVLLPFVYIATRLEGKGPLFISQERIGRGWTKIRVYKFRTMTQNEQASAAWVGESGNKITKVGAFLRKTSIDEIPQVFSVFKGDLSLIGPRSDIFGLGERLQESLPMYLARYSVTPGISGWAQVNQKYAPGNISPQSIDESRVRLMYDLYYVKHRSLLLDLSITLKTLKTLAARLFP